MMDASAAAVGEDAPTRPTNPTVPPLRRWEIWSCCLRIALLGDGVGQRRNGNLFFFFWKNASMIVLRFYALD